jgi:hypothetical protein
MFVTATSDAVLVQSFPKWHDSRAVPWNRLFSPVLLRLSEPVQSDLQVLDDTRYAVLLRRSPY